MIKYIFRIANIGLALIPLAHAGCKEAGPAELNVYVQDTAARHKFDAYLTWRDYDIYAPAVHENTERAKYVWNGEDAGTGNAGFREVLRRMEELPRNSSVLVFPSPYVGSGNNDHFFPEIMTTS